MCSQPAKDGQNLLPIVELIAQGLPAALARPLSSTKIIESPQSLIARFSGRVKN